MFRDFFTLAILTLTTLCCAVDSSGIQMPDRGVCAHRGNNAHFPENTVPAFKSAVELGATQVELDVCFSKDHHLVIMHDLDVKRTTDGSGDIRQKTLAELKALKIIFQGKVAEGVQVPTLQEVLDVIPKNVWINIHMKEDRLDLLLEIAQILKERGQYEQSFFFCAQKVGLEARKTLPDVKLDCMPGEQPTFKEYVDAAINGNFDFVQPNPWAYKTMEPEQIQRLRDAEIKINYFGVQNAPHAKELMKMGIDFPLCDDVTECVKEIRN